MFKPNSQPQLFNFDLDLSQKQRDMLNSTKESWFYKLIFCSIKEQDFKPLYSDKASRPNSAVNVLVSALIIKELKRLSFDELMEAVMFDLRFKTALGLSSIDEIPFSRATLFNFQNRIIQYEEQTKINLIEKVFDGLTKQQLKQLEIKADIQRTDSTMISSNIRRFSRVQLLIEILLRLERILDAQDKESMFSYLEPYLKRGSEKYVYELKPTDLPHELEKLGQIYYAIFQHVSTKYENQKEYINFKRVYNEHFVVVELQISPKPAEELHSGMLQSPDDQQATYRKKNQTVSKGYTINAIETSNPENSLQLITDIAVNPNNVDDSVILNERIDVITKKTPELKELHTDGGYGSPDNDGKLEELGITQITTAVRGRESEIEKTIEQISQSPDSYRVSCPYQTAMSEPTKQRHKVRFDKNICKNCPLNDKCLIYKNSGRFYFTHQDYLQNKRNNNIINIPSERRKIRPNVEALMKEFKTRTPNGKTKVRGIFKTALFAFNTGIAINFGRIVRYILKSGNLSDNLSLISRFMTIILLFYYHITKFRIFMRDEVSILWAVRKFSGHSSNKPSLAA